MVKIIVYISPINKRSCNITGFFSPLTYLVNLFKIFLRSHWVIFSDFSHDVTLFYHLKTYRTWFLQKFRNILHFFLETRLCHLIFRKKMWEENYWDNWLSTPNSISGKILVLELWPELLSTNQIGKFYKVQYLRNEFWHKVDLFG